VADTCNPRYLGDEGRRISSSRPAQAKVAARTCLKNNEAEGIRHMVELLPSIQKALG
jgi:hypothetical protein